MICLSLSIDNLKVIDWFFTDGRAGVSCGATHWPDSVRILCDFSVVSVDLLQWITLVCVCVCVCWTRGKKKNQFSSGHRVEMLFSPLLNALHCPQILTAHRTRNGENQRKIERKKEIPENPPVRLLDWTMREGSMTVAPQSSRHRPVNNGDDCIRWERVGESMILYPNRMVGLICNRRQSSIHLSAIQVIEWDSNELAEIMLIHLRLTANI